MACSLSAYRATGMIRLKSSIFHMALFQTSSISSSACSANELSYGLLGVEDVAVGSIENAKDESIIQAEYDAKSNPNNIGDLVIIANSLEEGCCRETIHSRCESNLKR